MRALIQRVREASVSVDDKLIGETGPGLLILICAMAGDSDDMPAKLAAKIARLRIFKDENGKMNRSLLDIQGLDIQGGALVVSQFTLAADTRRGNRPGFSSAAPPAEGERLYRAFAEEMGKLGIPTQTGQFGADMAVSLTNDGPVTIWMDTAD